MKNLLLLPILALASCTSTTSTYTDSKGNVVTVVTRSSDPNVVKVISDAAIGAVVDRTSGK